MSSQTTRQNPVPSLSPLERACAHECTCEICGVRVERISKFGPARKKHTPCKRLTRYLRATERALAEIDWQKTPEGIEARRQVRARLFALANRIAPIDWQRPRDKGEVGETRHHHRG